MNYAVTCVVLMLLADAAVAGADVFAKRWVGGLGSINLLSAMVAYNAATLLWLKFFGMSGELARASAIWSTTGVLVPVLIGRFWFGEILLPHQWSGLAMCVAGIFFVVLE